MNQTVAQLVVISGRSGSGKSTALHVLEDLGYYCIDNLPASLIPNLVDRSKQQKLSAKIAVSIDAETLPPISRTFRSRSPKFKILMFASSSWMPPAQP